MGGGLLVFFSSSESEPVKHSPPPPNTSHPNQWEHHEYFTHLRQARGKREEEVCPDRLLGGEGGLGCQGANVVQRWGFSP